MTAFERDRFRTEEVKDVMDAIHGKSKAETQRVKDMLTGFIAGADMYRPKDEEEPADDSRNKKTES